MFEIGIIGMLLLVAGLAVLAFSILQHRRSAEALADTKLRLNDLKRKIENEQREASLKIKDELYNKRKEFEDEIRKDRAEMDRTHKKINDKFDDLTKREQRLEDFRYEMQQKERDFSRRLDAFAVDE